MGDLIVEIVFWIIRRVLRGLFERTRDPSKEARPTRSSRLQEQQGRLSTALKVGSAAAGAKQPAQNNETRSAPDYTRAALQQWSQPQVSDVWREYRKKQDAIQKAQDSKAPKPHDFGRS